MQHQQYYHYQPYQKQQLQELENELPLLLTLHQHLFNAVINFTTNNIDSSWKSSNVYKTKIDSEKQCTTNQKDLEQKEPLKFQKT